MKNKEKFIDKLADFACIRDNIATNVKGELVGCYGLLCENCKFYTEKDCGTASREWLEREYVEQMVISRKDVRLLECIKMVIHMSQETLMEICSYISIDQKKVPELGSQTWNL